MIDKSSFWGEKAVNAFQDCLKACKLKEEESKKEEIADEIIEWGDKAKEYLQEGKTEPPKPTDLAGAAGKAVDAMVGGLKAFSDSQHCLDWYKQTADLIIQSYLGKCVQCGSIMDDLYETCSTDLLAAGADMGATVGATAMQNAFQKLAESLMKTCEDVQGKGSGLK